ncbi:hypothetical protein PV331_43680 [Streptomyces sp. WI04-05B]|nr:MULTISPECIES: hypothetical protein [unclassified Streptomyces]MDX2548692.1 hypothetical protein [Streptomyces sp. WI04-05B]MDX2585383.1 hypothetical protein [Streptomyces sp. WI04-05A]MDX3751477.1 hypothetical protein [Streptomyces sp. AK08-02]
MLVGSLTALVACGGRPGTDTASADVRRLLDRRSAAVLAGDGTAYARTGAAAQFTRLRALPLAAWSYRLTALHRTADGATADVELSYRVQGIDKAPVKAGRTLRLTRRDDGRWYVDDDEPARGTARQLWDEGTVEAVRGAHSLVLGVGQPPDLLRRYAGLADRAVPAVTDAWGGAWTKRVVILVPKSLEGMAGLLGAPSSAYRGIAAVTTGEAGGSPTAPADRIIVNPEAYGVLGGFGKQVVLTHETTHVATRTATSAATPLWLSEGYADWVGYRSTGRTAVQAAPELARAVVAGQVPDALPVDADFGFGGDAAKLAQAYEGGWLACRLIADRWGEVRLGEFYRAVGAHGKRAGAVRGALAKVLGTTPAEFTGLWREYLRAQLG